MKRRSHNNRKAFTMIEIIAVLVIVGLLSTVATVSFMSKIDEGKATTTKANLKQLSNAVKQFKMHTGRYPDDEEGLIVLVEQPADIENYPVGGFLGSTDLPLDGWKNEFDYQLYPPNNQPFVIISYGADGEEGGEDYNADLYSTDAN